MISFSSGHVPLPLLIFLYVSYMLADISVTLWCLLCYQTSVFRHPNPTFFFCLSLANRTNWFCPSGNGIKGSPWPSDLWCLQCHGLPGCSRMLWLPWNFQNAPPFHSFTFAIQKDWLCFIAPFPSGKGVIKRRESCVSSVQ